MMLEEVHVKLRRTMKLQLGLQVNVFWLRKGDVQQRAREQEKVPAGNDEFCFIALSTKESRMLLSRRNEINGLSVKIADV